MFTVFIVKRDSRYNRRLPTDQYACYCALDIENSALRESDFLTRVLSLQESAGKIFERESACHSELL